MEKFKNLVYVFAVSFALYNSSNSMEDNGALSQEEIVARLVAANENDLADNQLILANEKIRFLRKYENFFPALNVVSISFLDDEHLANEAVVYIKNKAVELRGLLEWRIFPITTPSTMSEILQDNGFYLRETSTIMICYMDKWINDKPKNKSISIERLEDVEKISGWAKIGLGAFDCNLSVELPYLKFIEKSVINNTGMAGSVEYYAGYYDGQLAATGGLFIGDDCCHIFALSTDEPFRNKGLATHMLLTLLERAKALNLKYVILQSEEAPSAIYTNVSFKKAFDMQIYCLES